MTTVRDLRSLSDMTQTSLASAAGTSQPTVAAYEAGRKSPTLATIERLAASVGKEAVVVYVAPLTREDRRSLAIHHVIAQHLVEDPDDVLSTARDNLERLQRRHPHALPLLDDWGSILDRTIQSILESIVDPSLHGRELRNVTPFAGVLTDTERVAVYTRFSEMERRP
jgi:transcriptional regulator with XRE-family HTH domain